MPVTLSKKRAFWWPIKVTRAEDGGWHTHEFKAQFVALKRAEFEALAEGERGVEEVLREHLIDWQGVQGEDGAPIAFTAEACDAALADIDILRGLMEGLSEASAGAAERKNSKPPPGP